MPGNSATVSIAIEVDDRGSVKIRQLGEAARKAGDEGARGFDAMGRSATGAERGVNTMATSLKALGGIAAAVAAAGVVQQLMQIGSASLKAASDMEQTQAKFDVVFRGMTTQAEAWATELRDKFAMSSLAAKNYMASIQNMLVPTGMAREEAGKLSFELTKLASDLASFNNKSTAQAFEDIMSALQGSSETMDKYGINVRESLVQQEAFTLGLARSKDEISQADRMLATYSLMLKQAGDAVGDTERSMMQAELQQRLWHARLEDFRVALGQGLLPVVNEMQVSINNWMHENEAVLKQDLATWAEIAAGGLRALFAVVTTLAEAYRGLKEAIVAVGVADMSGGPAMQAEAAAQGVEKLVSVVNKVPGALANITKAEAEIARIQGNIAKQGFASEQQTAGIERLKGQIEGYRATIAAAEAPTTATAQAVTVLDGSSKTAVASSDALARAAAGAAGALDTKGASAGRAAKSLEDMAREDERIGRQMLADHAARVKATQELTDNLNEHARKGAEEKRKALAEQLKLEYADEAANIDEKMQLEQDHADWVRSLQEGLLRDLEGGLGDFFYGFLRKEFDSLDDAFDSLCDSILSAFANLLAEMAAKWAMSGIMGLLRGDGFSGFSASAFDAAGGLLSGIGGGSGSGTPALSQYGPYAAGYQFGPGAGTSAAVTGGQAAGAALGAAGGAYGLYNAASQASKGDAGVGTALQAGISAYALYKAYPTIAAYLSGLGGASTASTAASGITIAATDLTLIGPQSGGIGNAIAGGGAQSGGLLGMGATATAFTGFGAFTAGLAALAAAGATPWQSITSPTLGIGVDMPIRGEFSQGDVRRRASNLTDPQYYTGTGGNAGGDAPDSAFGADLDEFDLQPLMDDMRGVLDLLANGFGDGLASLALQLDGTVQATDRMLDAAAGYDVALSSSAEITSLATQAAGGSENAMRTLRATLLGLGLSEQQTETAMLGLISATNTQAAALMTTSSAASSVASSVQSMTGRLNDFSNTPLNIRVNVDVDTNMGGDSYMAPRHASGGIFASPTLLPSITGRRHLVGEGGQAEAIMPLHAGPKTLELMHEDIRAMASRPVQVQITLDGRQIGGAVLPYVDAHLAAKAGRNQTANRTRF